MKPDNNNCGLPKWKRTLDACVIVLATPGLLLLAAVLVVIIRAVSNGPVLFRQERIGYKGRLFTCLKFRTMYCGSDNTDHHGYLRSLVHADVPMTKMDAHGDPRIIPFGKIMRASGLDELPQIINVLQGEMSLVGPRPCLTCEVEKFLPWQRERFDAVPGLTGLWQVNGKNQLTFTQMVQLDIRYARTKNLWLDLKILFKTIPVLVKQLSAVKTKIAVPLNHHRRTQPVVPVCPPSQKTETSIC